MNHYNSIIKKTISTLGAVAVLFSVSAPVHADSLGDQIAQAQAAANDAQAQADNYQARVDQLRAQATVLRSQIRVSQAKSAKLNADIAQAQADMATNKAVLSQNLKAMYLDSHVSPLEMLASSSDISQFFNQQQYQDKVKDKIQAAMTAIIQLKADLDKQQKDLAAVLADQQNQQLALNKQQDEINGLLAAAKQGAAAADAVVQQKSAEKSKLMAQQAAILAAQYGNSGLSGGGSCGGSYPGKWCNVPQDSVADNWGMYNRECVSYTAFKVAASGRRMPYWGGRGNAKEWPGSARADGIAVDGNPRAGDVAISLAGPYGHAMYVEAVSGGKVFVSQYNFNNNGEYSTMSISASGLNFIHF
jgi:surface antigen